jgi:hypothetical protein
VILANKLPMSLKLMNDPLNLAKSAPARPRGMLPRTQIKRMGQRGIIYKNDSSITHEK